MLDILSKLDEVFKKHISRRGFLKILATALLALFPRGSFVRRAFASSGSSDGRKARGARGEHDIVLASGPDPYANTVKAVKEMGGMERFVRKGDIVLVKPNIAWDRTPEQAANTDPGVVAALVDMAYKAGAKRVNVFDVTCNEERRCYDTSGIAAAAKEKGAFVFFPDHWNVVKAHFPCKSAMEGWPVIRDAVECDVFINAPVLKDHGLTGLTLSMKNLMGAVSGTRGLIHSGIGDKLVDLAEFFKPDLIVIDATRYLKAHGPSGGNLSDVVKMDKVMAATDPTLADMFAAGLVGRDPMALPNVRAAVDRSFGRHDLENSDIVRI